MAAKAAKKVFSAKEVIAPKAPNLTKAVSMPKAPEGMVIVIDYPQEKGLITHERYVIRIGSSEWKNVEISIDGGPWCACRHSAGYWWFDWGNYPLGKHKIVARVSDGEGNTVKKSTIRNCEYKIYGI